MRFRIFVVDYDVERRWHAELPEDPGFFLSLLWESAADGGGPLGDFFTWREPENDGWLAVNTRWFVESVERVAVRNYPLSDQDWAHIDTLQEEGIHQRDDGWPDEGLLVQADYEVQVTDPRWLEHLWPGLSWETGYYPDPTRRLRAEDAPHVPDLTEPEAVLTPFAGSDCSDSIVVLAFSDDGRFLAVTSEDGELAVYDADNRSERLRVSPVSAGRDIMWVPGRHVVTLKEDEDDEVRPWAYDLDADTETDIPVEPGRVRSRTGCFRVEYGDGGQVHFVSGQSSPDRTVRLGDESAGRIRDVTFSADETRMFVAHDSKVHVIEPATGRVLDTITVPGDWLNSLAASPDGAYLAVRRRTGPMSGSAHLTSTGSPTVSSSCDALRGTAHRPGSVPSPSRGHPTAPGWRPSSRTKFISSASACQPSHQPVSSSPSTTEIRDDASAGTVFHSDHGASRTP
ncbi:WD40 repeat domain-containing protein [Streptomyces sp. 3N207]|uniref:WD40 repeat domain-containing protein n=1 Tax=Streptomyces sp. 3N207 TaxID=3457417 RepID=UPI003FD384E0